MKISLTAEQGGCRLDETMQARSVPYVFISYARADGRALAEQVNAELIANELATWLDRRDLDPHQDFTAELERAIEQAAWVLVCVTPDSKRDDSFVRREIQYAILKKKPIVSLRFTDIDVHISLVNFTWLDFFRDWNAALQELLRILQSHSTSPRLAQDFDPYRPYLEGLYGDIVDYLDQTVFSLISLHVAARDLLTQKPVRTLPVGFTGLTIKSSVATTHTPKERSFQNFSEAFAHYGGRLVLLGEAGAGKTTTIMGFARDAAADRLADPSKPLPIVVPVSRWQKGRTLEQWLAEILPLSLEMINRLLRRGDTVLILDGLDELGTEPGDYDAMRPFDPRSRFLAILEELPATTPIAVTCRTKDYLEIGWPISFNGAIELEKLSDDQMREYLAEQSALLRAVEFDQALRELLRTPLLLSLFAYAYAAIGERAGELQNLNVGPTALRDEILRTYVTRRHEHERMRENVPLRFSLAELYEVFGHLAVGCLGSHSAATNRITPAHLRRMLDRNDVAPFLELGMRLHLLVSVEGGSFQFAHLLVLYHFAYPCALARLNRSLVPPLIGDVPWIRRVRRRFLGAFVALNARIWDLIPAWLYDGWYYILFATIGLLAGLLSIPLLVVGSILDYVLVIKVGYGLIGLGCCFYIELGWRIFIESFVDSPRKEAVQALGYANDDRAIAALETALDYGKADLQMNALEALAKIDPERVRQRRPMLVRLMSVDLTWVEGRAKSLFRRLGLERDRQ